MEESEAFDVVLPPRVVVGGGATARAGTLAARMGIRRVLVVTDPGLREHVAVRAVADGLAAAGIAAAVFDGVQVDPTVGNVADGIEALASHGADGVVAVGGGSPIDAAKGIAALAVGEPDRDLIALAGFDKVGGRALPLIAVPTTAGSGSEMTRAAVIADPARQIKVPVYDDALLPAIALVDHRNTLTMPRQLTAEVGIDALVHAVEAMTSRAAFPVTDRFSLEAARLIGPNLVRVCEQPDDDAARAAMARGATLAGAAISNATIALVHGMARPLGAHFHVAHGAATGILLAPVVRFGLGATPERYAAIARAAGAAGDQHPDEEAGERLVDWIERLVAEIGIPRLGAQGIAPEAFAAALEPMADAALASNGPEFNCREASRDQIVAIYREAW
ncbi:iron-containing alcohol dehydrogenase [Conexibacter woesei]|uniref:Iron-containing alcohol dehydrogenase n=1 Tax=Conexibacter woesei (strain DSM 14684 / CCUG 47730 / CIP 108061 / JCM 11494 / NBRC 100937 / ID131577) TaxID=469383 RepID=D3F9T4_CONWI|nr:iron-containing alcohol dehydrogenase [Conexibacter woesei]ADB51146.1 iron-containing alcohol dehydrogenase [Conexibacter woesei DSM 14684]